MIVVVAGLVLFEKEMPAWHSNEDTDMHHVVIVVGSQKAIILRLIGNTSITSDLIELQTVAMSSMNIKLKPFPRNRPFNAYPGFRSPTRPPKHARANSASPLRTCVPLMRVICCRSSARGFEFAFAVVCVVVWVFGGFVVVF